MNSEKSNNIVNLKGIVESLLNDMKVAREKHGVNVSRITNRETQLAASALKALHKDTKSRGSLAPKTLNRYITKVRTAIKNAGFVNPTYIKNLEIIKDANPRYKKRIEAIINADYKDSKLLIISLMSDIKSNEKQAKTDKTKSNLKSLYNQLKNKCLSKIDPVILSKLVRTDEEHDERRSSANELIESYQDETGDTVFSYSDIIALIPKLLSVSASSKNGWEKLALGIALATGRRSIEVMYKSQFTTAAGGRSITITGFAKKKDGDGGSKVIPCLADPQLIINAVQNLRSCERISKLIQKADAANNDDEKSEIINNSVHAQTADAATDILGKLLKDADGNLLKPKGKMKRIATLKTARDLYINCAFIEYKKANSGKLKIDAFTRNSLHHTEIGTALSYQKFKCGKEVSILEIKKAKQLKAIESDRLESLKKLQNSEVITSRKVLIKVMDFIIQQVSDNSDYIISTATLRNAIPNGKDESGKEKFKPICKPAIIGELVKLLKAESLDLPK